jgi:hypothetical protein
MKECFQKGGVKTADWYTARNSESLGVQFANGGKFSPSSVALVSKLQYPIVAKAIFGSRGRGNTLIKSASQMTNWLKGRDLSNYIFEKFHNYNREYRLHVSADGCFYTCRKMLKDGTPEADRWFRNDSNSVWIREENEDFDKPSNWKDIEEHCVLAMKSCGLDFGACDVRVQSAKDPETGKAREYPEFIIIEINSAPSFGTITSERYMEVLPEIITKKYQSSKRKS